MTKSIETENQRLNHDLDDLKSKFVELQTLVTDTDMLSSNELGGACGGCKCRSEASSTTSSVFSDSVPPPVLPNRQNANRSLIIDGVLERPFENLAAFSHRFVTDMGITISPDDIEVAFRLGRPNRSKPLPRPVKLVLKSEIIRDQIFYFKKRLRQSKIFSSFQLSLDLVRDVRVKMGILKRAANNARSLGREVYSQPHQIKIDGNEYDLSDINKIPNVYFKPSEEVTHIDPPPSPLNIRREVIYDCA